MMIKIKPARAATMSLSLAGAAIMCVSLAAAPQDGQDARPRRGIPGPVIPLGADFMHGDWCGTPMVALPLEDGDIAGGSAAHCGPLTAPPTTATVPNPGGDIYGPSFVYRIPVVFHVVHNGAGEFPNGMLTTGRVTTQITRLNADFAPMQIEFYLNTAVDGDGIMYHDNAVWFTSANAWSAASVDPHNNLNIFSLDLPPGLAGQANIPQGCGPACVPVGQPLDVVRLDFLVVGDPSLAASPYHQGRVATHEVGHYLGLYHTFEDANSPGCNSDTNPTCYTVGDSICDTPSHLEPTLSDCTITNTCPTGGNDPVANYMNYTVPTCQNNYSPEQMRRARCTLEHRRPSLWELVGGCPTAPAFGGNFTGTPHTLLSHVAKPGTTIFTPGPTCPPGLSDGAGEGGNVYAGSTFVQVGNEIGYKILHGGGDLRVELTGLATDLDLLLLGAAGTPASTLQRSENGGTTNESVFIAAAAPGTYYAVVDTFGAANTGSAFSLTYRGVPVGYNLDLNASAGAGSGPPAVGFGAAAAQPGTWTTLTDTATTTSLAVAGGFVTSAAITRSSGVGGGFTTDNANTSGDHQLLLDDAQDTPSGTTFTFANLPAGKYRVFTYAIAPDSAALQTNIAVTGSPDPVTAVGGAMPVNGFVLNDTHSSHRATVAPGGTIVVTATQFGGDFLTVNGFQIKPRPACPADTNGSDVVDVVDLLAVINGWGACPGPCPPSCAADTNADCLVTVTDLLNVINGWGSCPG